MAETRRGRGYVYALEYHIVWCVKYRHQDLSDEAGARLKEILMQVASDYNFTISELETDSDHIHVPLECTPQHFIPNMVKVLKGISETYKKLGGDHLWYPSYFVATVASIPKNKSGSIFRIRSFSFTRRWSVPVLSLIIMGLMWKLKISQFYPAVKEASITNSFNIFP